MNITDTHTHLYMEEFKNDIDHIINNSIKKGINQFFLPSINSSTINQMVKLKKKYPKVCYIMAGLHPNSVDPYNFNNELNRIKKWLDLYPYFIAIGEIGIDLYKNQNFLSEQKYVFEKQIEWAKEKKLPIVLHCRNAFNHIFDILSKKENLCLKGVFHCFSGNLEQAQKIIDLDIMLGIGGIITFKKNKIIQFLKKINLKNILLETDSPYLSPHPLRGIRNDPSNLIIILKKLSQIYSLKEETIAKITNDNVQKLFFKNK